MDELNDILTNAEIDISSVSSTSENTDSVTSELSEEDWNIILQSIDNDHREEENEEEENTNTTSLENTESVTDTIESTSQPENNSESNPTESNSAESNSSEPNLIPTNSLTLSLDTSTQRFSGTKWYNAIQQKCIIIAGLGGIGSNLAYQIARMHPCKLVLYDDDTVESENMAGQMFSSKQIGDLKVNAVSNLLRDYTTMSNVYAIASRFYATTDAGDIMMCGFDNMNARKAFFATWKNHVDSLPKNQRKNCLYLDGRLSIDYFQILAITGDDTNNIQRYNNEFLFSDNEAEETICSMKQTTYLSCMIASYMTNIFINFVANSTNPIIPYDIPFFLEYNAQSMLFHFER